MRVRISALLLALLLSVATIQSAFAQAASCTVVGAGTSQDITAHGECRKVTFAGLSGASAVCAVTGTTLAEWQSFYNNPPAGVTIAACSGGCSGYSYGGYCYYYTGDAVTQSCDTTCAGQGGCNAAGTRFIGSDDTSGNRCAAVSSALAGASVAANPTNSGSPSGCAMNTLKGGWLGFDAYNPTTTCGDASASGRICACNGAGGGAACALPWGGTVAHNGTVVAWNVASSCGGCASQVRTCNNGVLSGSYTNQTCDNGQCGGSCAGHQQYYGNCEWYVNSQANGEQLTYWYNDCGFSGQLKALCTNGSWSYPTQTCTCFVGETLITLEDGTTKTMAELKVGDVVRGQTRNNTVKSVPNYDTDKTLYGFNGGKAFVTGGHPFMTQDGWKAIDPIVTPTEGHSVKVGKLAIGDTIVMQDGASLKVESITPENSGTHHVYNPMLDGDNTYFANGLLAHNKTGQPCN